MSAPDRKQVALAILMVTQGDVSPEFAWSVQDDEVREELLLQADAVLALLVPAVRVAALQAAHGIISKRAGTYEAGIDLMERIAEIEAGA